MSEKRYHTDGQYVVQAKGVYVVCGGKHSADVVATALNELLDENRQLKEENEQLKQAYQTLKSRHSLLHDECLEAECDRDSLKKDVISLEKENEQLKKELFESEKDYIMETYSDNLIRRDEKIQGLKKEFKEKFGDFE